MKISTSSTLFRSDAKIIASNSFLYQGLALDWLSSTKARAGQETSLLHWSLDFGKTFALEVLVLDMLRFKRTSTRETIQSEKRR